MWSEKQKDHIKVYCEVCRDEIDGAFSDDERSISILPCPKCLDEAEENGAAYDEGYSQGYADGVKEGKGR